MIDWESIYNKLLESRKCDIGERHHIIPKHSGGTDYDGMVILSHKDHTLAHYIRWKWKKEPGDLAAYTIMSGQEKNPMNISGVREDLIKKIKEYSNKPEYKEKRRKEAVIRWNDQDIRKKYIDGKSRYINSLSDKSIIFKHLHTEDNKKRGTERIKNWMENNPEKHKECLQKGKNTRINNIKNLTPEELKSRFGRPGNTNPNWECYYIIFKDGIETVFESQAHLLRETNISRIAVNKYKDTDVEMPRGKLKGYKIKTAKILEK
jgi:hypothetical protein